MTMLLPLPPLSPQVLEIMDDGRHIVRLRKDAEPQPLQTPPPAPLVQQQQQQHEAAAARPPTSPPRATQHAQQQEQQKQQQQQQEKQAGDSRRWLVPASLSGWLNGVDLQQRTHQVHAARDASHA